MLKCFSNCIFRFFSLALDSSFKTLDKFKTKQVIDEKTEIVRKFEDSLLYIPQKAKARIDLEEEQLDKPVTEPELNKKETKDGKKTKKKWG